MSINTRQYTQIFFALLVERNDTPKRNDTPVAVSTSSVQILVFNTVFQ